MNYIIAIFTLLSQFSSAATEKVLGTYSPDQMRTVKVGCLDQNVNFITLVPEKPAKCNEPLIIKSFVIYYPNGIDQHFDYQEKGRSLSGTPLKISNFNVLPGTKCLSHISANIIESKSRSCVDHSKVKVIMSL